MKRIRILLISLLFLANQSNSQTLSFQGLGTLPGSLESYPRAISSDGSTVTGISDQGTSPFIWTSTQGIRSFEIDAHAIRATSGEGRAVGSRSVAGISRQATILRNQNGVSFESISNVLDNFEAAELPSVATGLGITQEGTLIVTGVAETAGNSSENGSIPFVWKDFTDSMVAIGSARPADTPGLVLSTPPVINPSGSVVVGATTYGDDLDLFRAYLWSQEQQLVLLYLPEGANSSVATAVSESGKVVGGYFTMADDPASRIACLWKSDSEFERLDSQGARGVRVSAVYEASDATTAKIYVIGAAVFDPNVGEEAAVWSSNFGWRSLRGFLSENGAEAQVAGWKLTRIVGGNKDGTIITGEGVNPSGNPQAWIASIPLLPELPVIDSPTEAVAGLGKPFEYLILSSGAASTVIDGVLPPGLTFNPETSLLSGTATQSGLYTFAIVASNSSGSIRKTLKVRVVSKPRVTSDESISAFKNMEISHRFEISGSPTMRLKGILPSGLNFDRQKGLISGRTTETGVFAVTLVASNVAGSTEQEFTITVHPSPAIKTRKVFYLKGQKFLVKLKQTTGANLRFEPREFGTTGLKINTKGEIHGIPTRAGIFKFKINATSGSIAVSKELTINITNTKINENKVKGFTKDVRGSLRFEDNVVRIFLKSGTLPKGMRIATDRIKGIPTRPGVYRLVVEKGFADGAKPGGDQNEQVGVVLVVYGGV